MAFGYLTSSRDLLCWAASVEMGSEHPLGKAVVRKAEEQGIALGELTDFEALRGKGVQGVVDGRSVLVGSRALMEEYGVAVAVIDDEMRRLEDERCGNCSRRRMAWWPWSAMASTMPRP